MPVRCTHCWSKSCRKRAAERPANRFVPALEVHEGKPICIYTYLKTGIHQISTDQFRPSCREWTREEIVRLRCSGFILKALPSSRPFPCKRDGVSVCYRKADTSILWKHL